jgi:acetylornithine deacetylase
MPELGRSAILDLIDWIAVLRGTEAREDAKLGREVWNLGLMSGGRAANVVPDHAEAELVLRTIPGGALVGALEAARPDKAEIEVLVKEAWDEFDLIEGFPATAVPFGSDLPALRALVPEAAAILAGPGDPRLAHTIDERLTWHELDAGVDLYVRIGEKFL